jgi:hypothetical protein
VNVVGVPFAAAYLTRETKKYIYWLLLLNSKMSNTDVKKPKVTVISLWDSEVPELKLFTLDVYNAHNYRIPAKHGSVCRNRAAPRGWWEMPRGGTELVCLFPERVTNIHKWFASMIKPITVIEVYGSEDRYFHHDYLTHLFIGGMQSLNPGLSPEHIKAVGGWSEDNHSVLNIEMPLAAIQQTLDALVERLPPEATNVVVRDYQRVGEYTTTG